jgi:hypothetical protein
MASKSVEIEPNPRNKPSSLDEFVTGERAQAEKPKMKRLTFDIPADLHKRIKRTCLEREEDMATELRRILAREFPE